MEGSFLQAVETRSLSAAPRSHFRLVEPPIMALVFLALDSALFALPGLAIAARDGLLAPHTPTTLPTGLALCLGGGLFLALCRALELHDPVKLVRRSTLAQLATIIVCIAGPILALLLICGILSDGMGAGRQDLLRWLMEWGAWSGGLALVVHGTAKPVLQRWRAANITAHKVAIVGSGEPARRLTEWLQANAADIVEVVGIFDDRKGRGPDRVGLAHLICGTTGDLIEYYRKAPLDRIIIALPHHAEERLLSILQRLKQLPVEISLAPDLVRFRVPDASNDDMVGLRMLSLARRPLRASQRFVKEVIDRAVAAMVLLLLAPLMLGIALAVRLTSPGPVFFRQERHGLGNRVFQVLKFRSMRVEPADSGPLKQTERNDPRVTALGAFLRRTSLDELPQLINVLRGDMSLVGPRPLPTEMRVQDRLNYEVVAEYAHRHRVKPGITGLAQVKGHRGAVSTPEALQSRVAYDLYYIDHWSLWLDLKILLATGAVCAFGKNAF